MTTAWTTDTATDDAARAVTLTLLWGLDGVAVRGLGGGRVPNVPEASLRRRLDEAELPILALDPGLFEGAASARAGWLNDLAALDDVAAFGRRVACGLVRVGALAAEPDTAAAADALRQAGVQAARLGLQLAVRNEVGTAVDTGRALADLLTAIGHPSVGADWRPADALVAGEAPDVGFAALRESEAEIVCVSVRDGQGDDGEWSKAIVGEGRVGWTAVLAMLAQAGFEGPLIIDEVPQPTRPSGLASSTALIRGARQARRDLR